MSSPSSQLGRLSLETMPVTRSGASSMPPPDPPNHQDNLTSSDSDTSSIYSSDDEESPVVRSPARLLYNLSSLSEGKRTFIRDTFNDPPQIALQQCRSLDGTYAFQMTELVTRSIRIHDTEDGTARLSCSCKDGDDETCPHLIWLLDQLVKQTFYEQDHTKVLDMTENAYPVQLGDPYEAISTHHLDILAADLHCPVMDKAAGTVDPTRALEAREMLSSIYNQPPEDFRSDIFNAPTKGQKPIKRHDLEQTVFRMLVDNSDFFNYFLSLSRSSDTINDPFRKLSHRIDLVLQALDNPHEPEATVSWAATHILGCVTQIRTSVFSRDRPLSAAEASSATSTLVHILTSTLERHTPIPGSLYHRLIGDRDRDFVVSTLELLPEAASPFLHNLEELVDRMRTYGVPASYMEKFRALFGRLRKSRTGAGAKRQSQDGVERRVKRAR